MPVNITLPIFFAAIIISSFAILTFLLVKNKIGSKIYLATLIFLLTLMFSSMIKITNIPFWIFFWFLEIIIVLSFTFLFLKKKIKKFLYSFIVVVTFFLTLFISLISIQKSIQYILLIIFLGFVTSTPFVFLLYKKKIRMFNSCIFILLLISGFVLLCFGMPGHYVLFVAVLYLASTWKKEKTYNFLGGASLFSGIICGLSGIFSLLFAVLFYSLYSSYSYPEISESLGYAALGIISYPILFALLGIFISIIPIIAVLRAVCWEKLRILGAIITILAIPCFIISVIFGEGIFHVSSEQSFMYTYTVHLLSLSLGITFLMLGPALVVHAKSKKNLFGIGCALLPSFLFIPLLTFFCIFLTSIIFIIPLHFFIVGIFALASGILTNRAAKYVGMEA